jgi:hypothetical protein
MVHGIVQSHGGVINVASTPGRGTTFEVLLPFVQRFASKAIRAHAAGQDLYASDSKGTMYMGM